MIALIIIFAITIVLFTLAVIIMSCIPNFYNSKIIWGLIFIASIDFACILGIAIYWIVQCL